MSKYTSRHVPKNSITLTISFNDGRQLKEVRNDPEFERLLGALSGYILSKGGNIKPLYNPDIK
ncbi:MAG: hypothetical protein GF353_24755 [Candidatus Lokiarchaeota archaeon]|nr:hypothetical protein [Candidatus Lokiarchaeota archaeon]